MLPTHQGFAGDDSARESIDDGLIVEHELLSLEGASEVVLQVELAQHQGVHGLVVHEMPCSAVGLGLVHGDVGVAENLIRVVVLG